MFRRNRHIVKALFNNLAWGLSGAQPPAVSCHVGDWVRDNPQAGALSEIAPAEDSDFPPLTTVFGEIVSPQMSHFPRPAQWIATFENGRAVGKHGAVITCDNQLIREASEFIGNDLGKHPLMTGGRLPPVCNVEGSVAVIASLGSYTYYHWLLDAIPRLGLLEQAGIGADYYYAPQNAPFHDEIAELLGFQQDRLISATRRRHVQAQRLVVPAIPSSRHVVPSSATTYLRERLLKHQLSNKTPRRIYVTRNRTRWRRVLNETQVAASLAQYGYQVVELESMSVREQIALFARADCIVAPHGAALANCVFCSPNTKVLEIATPYRPLRCFYHLCHQLSADFHYFIADGVQPNQSRQDSQLNVNIDQLREALAIADMA